MFCRNERKSGGTDIFKTSSFNGKQIDLELFVEILLKLTVVEILDNSAILVAV